MNVWVNGCFDILHTGHIDLLWYAKLYGTDEKFFKLSRLNDNYLIVGLDSDERIRQMKGDGRPINNQIDRAKIIFNLKPVDEIITFNSNIELERLIKSFNIDYIIIGDQYKDKHVIGAEFAKYGVIYYPVDNRSTTNIIEKIKKT